MFATVGALAGLPQRSQIRETLGRPVTVADAIQMTRVAGSGYPGSRLQSEFAVFSPDGSRFVVVVSKGDLSKDANEYSLLLFRSADTFTHGAPKTLVSFSSSSDREGIFDVSWSGNNDTIYFLGSRGGEPSELYSVRCSSGKLEKLTRHATSLMSYAVSQSGNTVAYSARPSETILRSSLQVSGQTPWDLIRGCSHAAQLELFIKEGRTTARKLQTSDPVYSGDNDLYLAPDGRHLIVKIDTPDVPPIWKEYDNPALRMLFRMKLHKGQRTNIFRYELIDVETNKASVLLDSPAFYARSDVLWSPDSRTVLLCGVYLPLDVSDPLERQTRRSSRFVVAIDLVDRRMVKITNDDLSPVHWSSLTNVVQFTMRRTGNPSHVAQQIVSYRQIGGIWKLQTANPLPSFGSNPDVFVEENLNSPPRIVAMNPVTKRRTTLVNLNPNFSHLAFGQVEEIQWNDDAGNRVSGGLYLPPGYIPGKRYPLVIQTHGFEPDEFWIDGPYSTAFAAQPLASRGIMVLQVSDVFSDTLGTSREAQRAMSGYESAVEYLYRKGFIDRNRVGLIGFSRTCYYVKYTLTHSKLRFAAAIAVDGFDGGYLQYLFSANENADSDFDSVVGAPPFGAGLAVWLKRSPGFLMDKVRTPVLLQALGPASLLGEWQWFSGLRLLKIPVDLLYLPNGEHILVRPRERLASLGETVDWFCFWLKGEASSQPNEAGKYLRWTGLRKQLENLGGHN